jgi:hypothetical protein
LTTQHEFRALSREFADVFESTSRASKGEFAGEKKRARKSARVFAVSYRA